MSLTIIGAGFGRTGTTSLRAALERLGYAPCDHMIHSLEHPGRFPRWLEAARAKAAGEPYDWERLFRGYRACVDWPGAFFWRELAAAYPEAKVILTVRDPERWHASTERTIWRARRSLDRWPVVPWLLRRVAPLWPAGDAALRVNDAVIWDGTFGGRFADRAHALAVWDAHVAEVIATIPPERLLVLDVAEGWGPLCAFLGVPVPDGEPFPHLNDTAWFERRVRSAAVRAGAAATVGAAMVAAGLWARGRVRGRPRDR